LEEDAMKKPSRIVNVLPYDHPVVQLMINDMVERHGRIEAGEHTILDLEQERDPPFFWMLDGMNEEIAASQVRSR
jgi:hypothetical protein